MTNSRARVYTRIAIKTADETVNNSTTMQDDDDLKHTVKANTSYTFKLIAYFISASTPDIKSNFTGPSGSTIMFVTDTYSCSVAYSKE